MSCRSFQTCIPVNDVVNIRKVTAGWAVIHPGPVIRPGISASAVFAQSEVGFSNENAVEVCVVPGFKFETMGTPNLLQSTSSALGPPGFD
jgi:hypothetical protein